MKAIRLDVTNIDFVVLNAVIRDKVPSGMQKRKKAHELASEVPLNELTCKKIVELSKCARGMGTLGSGNHFIETDKDDDGNFWLVIQCRF